MEEKPATLPSIPTPSYQAAITTIVQELQQTGCLSPHRSVDPTKIGQIVIDYMKNQKKPEEENGSVASSQKHLVDLVVTKGTSTRRNSDSSASVSGERSGGDWRKEKELKKRRERRQSSLRRLKHSTEVFTFKEDAKEVQLPDIVRANCQGMYQRGISSSKIYLSVKESLHEYYSTKTFPNSVESAVREFLRKNMFTDWKPQITEDGSVNTELFRIECETYVLLKLCTLEGMEDSGKPMGECERQLSELHKFLQGLKMAITEPTIVNHFLEGAVVELFLDSIPRCVEQLLEDNEVPDIPLELQKPGYYHTIDSELPVTSPLKLIKPKPRHHAKSHAYQHRSKQANSNRNKSQLYSSRSQVRSSHGANRNLSREINNLKIDMKVEPSVWVADTPVKAQDPLDYLSKKRTVLAVDDSPVRQSPRQHPSTIARKKEAREISQLESLILKSKKHLEQKKRLNGKIHPTKKNIVLPLHPERLGRQSSRNLPSTPPKTPNTSGNDNFRLSSPRRLVSEAEKCKSPSQHTPVKRRPQEERLSATKNPKLHSDNSRVEPKSPNFISPGGSADESLFELSDQVVDKYKSYVQKLRSSKSRGKLNADDVFYGRGSVRPNVFQDTNPKSQASVVTRQTATYLAKTPKNRSGRKVREDAVSHVANYLLNENNLHPSSPVIPKYVAMKISSPFKLTRLLRLPSRSKRRSLDRDARRFRLEDQTSNSSSGQSDTFKKPLDPPLPEDLPQDLVVRTVWKEPAASDALTRHLELKKLEGLMLSPRNNGLTHQTYLKQRHCAAEDAKGRRRRASVGEASLSPTRRSQRCLTQGDEGWSDVEVVIEKNLSPLHVQINGQNGHDHSDCESDHDARESSPIM